MTDSDPNTEEYSVGWGLEPTNRIPMHSVPDAICPLCSQVYLRENLHSHIAREERRARDKTIQHIRAYHKDWLAENGACQACWKSFREAARVLSLLKQTKRQRRGYGWQRPGPTDGEHDPVGLERPILS